MKIAAVIVTCNRLDMLPRALVSIKNQIRQPDYVYLVSNSDYETVLREEEISNTYGFSVIVNKRTKNNAGGINTALVELIKDQGISSSLYVALLDDDDEWLPDYLATLQLENTNSYDLLLAELSRSNGNASNIQHLPTSLNIDSFLKGNPGVGNSNTFVKLTTLLKAGCFDEACISNVDRDLFIRLFQLNPSYKIVNRHLVNHYTDNGRPRITNNISIREKSFQYFYYKYSRFMSEEIKQAYFDWSENLFGIKRFQIDINAGFKNNYIQKEICFDNKDSDYQFVIGFIAGNDKIAKRLVKQIIDKVPADLVIIIDDAPKLENLDGTYQILKESHIPFKIVRYKEWNANLINGYYGEYFEKFDDINSIPLGRTILHRHLFDETTSLKNPVYWIIDDDIDLNAISINNSEFKLFDLINQHKNNTDALIGGISNDPPIPALSCIRTQLVDFLYSYKDGSKEEDFLNISSKVDYYYDLSDIHSDHLEAPIYKAKVTKNHINEVFSGKAVFRPALQRELKSEYKTITRRGANTIVLNREVLRLYPVINLEVNEKFARRGDLTWALFNQLVSNKIFIEHTFCINHNRPLSEFKIDKELDKSAYDIIGYAFNKAILKVIEGIKNENKNEEILTVFSKLLDSVYFNELKTVYLFYLAERKSKFLINYFRIIGLTKIIWENYNLGGEYYSQFKDESKILLFDKIMLDATSEEHLKGFLEELKQLVEENKEVIIKK